jgi:hypothetical protein
MEPPNDRPCYHCFSCVSGVTQLDFTGPYQVLVRTPEHQIDRRLGWRRTDRVAGLTFSNLLPGWKT